ncbi:MAG: DeoR/GlpR family DNA-binding transcription regulator [Planctomycetaceae bacterium]|nr:DeoR/GlpR family DNA-binding transcription regulator [Planctomycetaceae bacterium]
MLGIERRQKIFDQLQRDRKVHVGDLAESFNVTQETIRRDLKKLEAGGHLQRSHGGAVLLQPGNEDLSFAKRTAENYELKQIVARKAAGLVTDGASLMADSSSTILALFDLLRARKDLTVVTNSNRILNDFSSSSMELISTGGNLRAHSQSLVGPAACRTIATYCVDVAVFSCKGIDREHGITESNEPEAVVKQAMAKQAKNRVLLVDSTKFDQVVFAKTLEFSDIEYVITDAMPNRRWIDFFRKNEIQLVC